MRVMTVKQTRSFALSSYRRTFPIAAYLYGNIRAS